MAARKTSTTRKAPAKPAATRRRKAPAKPAEKPADDPMQRIYDLEDRGMQIAARAQDEREAGAKIINEVWNGDFLKPAAEQAVSLEKLLNELRTWVHNRQRRQLNHKAIEKTRPVKEIYADLSELCDDMENSTLLADAVAQLQKRFAALGDAAELDALEEDEPPVAAESGDAESATSEGDDDLDDL